MAQVALIAATAVTAMGQVQEGNAASAAGEFSARQNLQNAKQSKAEGIRRAIETRRQGDVLKSDATAAMAAGGGVTDDVGAIKTLADIEQVMDYNAMAAIYESDLQSQQQQLQASMDSMAGNQRKKASRTRAVGTVMSGASKAYTMGKK